MAERQGFEPWIPCGIHAFQACAFSHSAISPLLVQPFDSNTGRPLAATTLAGVNSRLCDKRLGDIGGLPKFEEAPVCLGAVAYIAGSCKGPGDTYLRNGIADAAYDEGYAAMRQHSLKVNNANLDLAQCNMGASTKDWRQ